MLEPLELAAGRREQVFRSLDVPIHRAADVKEKKDFHRIAALRPPLHVDESLFRAAMDRIFEIELFGRALARKAAQPPQRDLDRAGTERLVAVEIPKIAPVPDLRRMAMTALLLADANALWVFPVRAEGRGSRSADPFRPALMAALLLGKPLAKGLHQLFETHGLELRTLLHAEVALDELEQPFFGNCRLLDRQSEVKRAFEGRGERDVKFVKIALVLDEQRSRQMVEILDRLFGQVALHRLHQRQIFARGDRNMGDPQRGEEREKHAARLWHGAPANSPPLVRIFAWRGLPRESRVNVQDAVRRGRDR